MTINEIKAAHEAAHPTSGVFKRVNLKVFNLTLKHFKVYKNKLPNKEHFYTVGTKSGLIWGYFMPSQPQHFFNADELKDFLNTNQPQGYKPNI
jgi:hypothetical protein